MNREGAKDAKKEKEEDSVLYSRSTLREQLRRTPLRGSFK